jgi:YD repeat-containing protein
LTYKLGATTLGTVSYGYDAAGNRTMVGGTWARTGLPQAVASASYNANNQQLTFGAATMTYDNNGNLATLQDASGVTTYTWNARNQLTGLSGPGLTATFGYDGLGRRWTKAINGARTDFLYDGLDPVQEGVLPGTVGANVLAGLGLDEVLTRTDVTGTRAFLPDALGSTLDLADADAGRNAARQAIPLLERVIREHGEPDDVAMACNDAAWAYNALGDPDKTIELCQECLRRQPDPRRRLPVLMTLAEALRLAGRSSEAEDAAVQGLIARGARNSSRRISPGLVGSLAFFTSSSLVVPDAGVSRSRARPAEDHPPLAVDPDAVRAEEVALERRRTVPGR